MRCAPLPGDRRSSPARRAAAIVTARLAPVTARRDQRDEGIGEAGDRRGDEADAPQPRRIGPAERAEEIGAEAPARAAAELGEDRAEHRVRRGDPQAAEERRQARAQPDEAHDRALAAAIGADHVDGARIDLAQAHGHRHHGREVDRERGEDDARRRRPEAR